MKISDIRLYNLEVYNDNQKIYEGMSENVPNELKDHHILSLSLKSNKLIVQV